MSTPPPEPHPDCEKCERDNDTRTAAQFRKLWQLSQSFGLDRDERIELAEMILRRDVRTWSGNEFSHQEANKLITALEGYYLVEELLALRTQRDTA